MRALVTRLRSDRRREKVLVADWAEPDPAVGNQVVTQTIYSGVTNGTERNDLMGGNYAHPDEALPAGWGYQNVGQIVELGPDVQHLQVGDVLYASADHVEYAVVPEDGLLIVLPPPIDPKQATLFGMASVAMRSCRNADLRMGERVLIVGQGCIGQFAALIARAMGVRVAVCEIDPRRLDLARTLGAADEVFDVSGDGWEEQVKDCTYDAVLDLAGVPGMEDQLIRATRSGGSVSLIAGRSHVHYTFNLGQGRRITIRQNGHFRRDDLENVCRLVVQGTLCIEPVIQDVVPVAEAARVYDALRDAPHELMGTVFEW